MLLRIVGTRYRTTHISIVGIVVMIHIVHVMAVVVMFHIRRHVCLIVPEVIHLVMAVMAGEVIPVVRRTPVGVCRATETVKQRRTFVINRFDDVVCTIDIRRADHLNVRRSITHLHHQRGYILIDVRCQHGLDEQYVRVSFQGLQHAQVINIPVAVQIEVGDNVRT